MTRYRRTFLALFAVLMALAAIPGRASAQYRNMGWGDSTPGHMELVFDCESPPPDVTLVVSFISPVTDIIGLTAKVDMCTEPHALPDWWRFDVPGGCREGLFELSTNFAAGPSSHPVAWGGALTTSVQVVPGYAWSDAMNRFLVTIAIANGKPPPLVVGEEYYAFKLRFLTPVGTCAGCDVHACFVINDLTITSSSGKVETFRNDGDYAMWQGQTYPGCPFVVPATSSSWGRLKATYH
jgi:hypothetical protein